MENKNVRESSVEGLSAKKDEAIIFGLKGSDKIEAFENMLLGQIRMSDNIQEATEKMVRAAIATEFGEKILKNKKSKDMVRVISQSILCETELRRQALLIMDRFAKADELNA